MNCMEIQKIDKNSIRIKGKNGVIVVDPQSSIKAKVSANCIILLSKEKEFSLDKIEDHSLIIQGPGEYEISGIKINTLQNGPYLLHKINIDEVEMFLADSSVLEESKEITDGSPIVVFLANETVDQSLIAKLTPQILALYGEKAEDQAKQMGKETQNTSKLQIKNEKLPEEMEVVCLT